MPAHVLIIAFAMLLGPEPVSSAPTIDGPDGPALILAGGPAGAGPAVAGDSAREIVGEWVGGLEQGGAVFLRLGVTIAAAPDGGVTGHLDSPDQGARGIPLAAITLDGDSAGFDVPSLGARFRGTLDATRTTLSGTWTQGPASVPMTLRRSMGPVSFARPQEPDPPFPYAEAEVTFENPDDGTRLAGTLTLPDGSGPFPAAVLLSGSGPQDRNGTLAGHRPFLVLADHLARQGVAVLRFDDRGVGGSTGDVMDATIEDNVRDAAAAVALLRAHPAIDGTRVGAIGHSEGGWVAQALAAGPHDAAFVVLLAGPAVPPGELLIAQGRAMLGARGDSLIEEQLAMTRRAFELIRAEPDDDRAITAITAATDAWLDSLPAGAAAVLRGRRDSEEYRAERARLLQIQTTPWFRGLLAHDPAPALRGLHVPVLALFGERDLQVPAAQSVPVLEEAWADHPDAAVHVFPGLNHLFQHAPTGLPAEYARLDETFAPEALERIGRWIVQRFGP